MTDGPSMRWRVSVRGLVQGVGFRPHVYARAREHCLSGFVQNTSAGVTIEVEGTPQQLKGFQEALSAYAPPLARIHHIEIEDVPVTGVTEFVIRDSSRSNDRTGISPDAGLCGACRAELHDPSNRRYRHPFINCTDCGPRLTIIRRLPYDRAATAMSGFALCEECAAEFADPHDRRFHAQAVACPACGPKIVLVQSDTTAPLAHGDAAIARALDIIAAGRIVAIKGIGGFHLACDAANAAAVQLLRDRKQRPHKPFAVLVACLTAAQEIAMFSETAQHALEGIERPIVLADARASTDVVDAVAPCIRQIGVMLPYSPVHDLLATDWRLRCRQGRANASGALVMTSANTSELPVIINDGEAVSTLAGIADAVVLHNRDILVRCDDSVVASLGDRPIVPIRRSRGYVPAPIALPGVTSPVLAVGGELKSAFCLAVEGQAFPGPHLGDMNTIETLDAFTTAVDHFCTVLGIEPVHYVCDAHPGYLSARWAEQASRGAVRRVQHHHAHAASLMAEHQLGQSERLLTFCFDGTGYGSDGAVWGGEVLDACYQSFSRRAHLSYMPQPPGDVAVRQPWRMAVACLHAAGVSPPARSPVLACADETTMRIVARQLDAGTHTIQSSSMGRLFDAIASLTGVCLHGSYEAQPAMELETRAAQISTPYPRYAFETCSHGIERPSEIMWAPVVRAIAADVARGVAAAEIAASFHDAVAGLVVDLARTLLAGSDQARVGLTGGVFQNRVLLGLTLDKLEAAGIRALTHQTVPSNDGGLALGQAAIAAHTAGD